VGLRDRALMAVMTYTFARLGAVVAMRVEDYYPGVIPWGKSILRGRGASQLNFSRCSSR